uniref:Ycf23 n=1 Tax=Laurencia catarinensis TaxID=197326 RepID=UPI0028D6121D|nr:Ycf23 [Laurencia catarinensis]WMP12424.1 Ycf23 [Laurencia catarinensis]
MNLSNVKLYSAFKSKEVIKIITGIDNVNISQIVSMAKAAELSGATYLDVAANPKIVKLLKSFSSLPVCVSSISPIDLYNCVVAGADVIEIGNFDVFYSRGVYINCNQVLQLVKEVKRLLGNTTLCVTIPYHISIKNQIHLAQALEFLGVNIIQTESTVIKNKLHILDLHDNNITNSFLPSHSSLLSTYFISTNVQIPVITSSSINALSSSISLLFGASGIGVGSVIRNQSDLSQMSNYVKLLRKSMSLNLDQKPIILNQLLSSNNLFLSDLIKA